MARLRAFVLVLAVGILAGPALAHKLTVFAMADGMSIRGEVYHTPGGPVKNGTITVLGSDGETLHSLETASDGTFSFEATAAVDHRIVCETVDGHQAAYTVKAAELGAVPTEDVAEPAPKDAEAPATAEVDADLDERVAAAVRNEIAPLRQALAEQQDALRLRDILGGIGYIVGFAGLLALIKTRRTKVGS